MTENNLSIDNLKVWLIENNNYFNFSINETSCNKWSALIENKNSHIYPCVCSKREKHCIFIETYYKFEKAVKLHTQENYLGELVEWYNQIRDNNDSVLDWILKCKEAFEDLQFNLVIEIATNLVPYETIKFQLSKDDFPNIIAFQKIYLNELYKIDFEK